MEFDSISLSRPRPDASVYEKGLRMAVNAVPYDAGNWREATSLALIDSESLADAAWLPTSGGGVCGTFADANGTAWLAVKAPSLTVSRLYEFSSATLTNRTPGTDYAGTPARFRFTKFGTSVIAAPENVNVGAAVQLQVRSGAGNFANLVTSVDRPAPKFIGVSKSHVVGAHNLGFGGAGVYAAANPYQVMWCARNDAAEWTPGTDRAGFLQVRDARGEITGISCFTEFFLVFQQYGVTRYSWIGGDTVWEAQEIAGAQFGIPNAALDGAIVQGNREAYYLSSYGPAIVINGEAVEPLGDGEWRRFLWDPALSAELQFSFDRASVVTGELEPESGLLLWSGKQVTGGAPFQVAYRPGDGRISVINGYLSQDCELSSVRGGWNGNPLSSFALFQVDIVTLNLEAYRPTASPRSTLAAVLYTNVWRAATGKRSSLQGVRTLLRMDLGTLPEVTVEVRPIFNPSATAAPATFIATQSDANDNGWISNGNMPAEGNEFTFVITVPDIGASGTVLELPALELAFSSASVF